MEPESVITVSVPPVDGAIGYRIYTGPHVRVKARPRLRPKNRRAWLRPIMDLTPRYTLIKEILFTSE